MCGKFLLATILYKSLLITLFLCKIVSVDIFIVKLTKKAEAGLRKLPAHVIDKLYLWVDLIETEGLREARKISAFHDEPLKGKRRGQRSIRLNKAYRAFYIEKAAGGIELVEVIEVNKHEY